MYFKYLVFVIIVILVMADVKPDIVDKNELTTKEIEVEVIFNSKKNTFKTINGITIEEFLAINNLDANSKLNLTYTLSNHDVINLDDANKLSINSISFDELKEIPYISENNAKDIIEYRNVNGLFKTLEEVKNVKGIGDSKLKILSEYLTL